MKNNSYTSAVSKIKEANYDKINRKMRRSNYAIASIFLGLIIGMILIAILGANPFIFISSLFKGSFQSSEDFGNFLANFSWLLLVGLSVGLALKMGLFNIGVTGQFLLGGITGFYWAYFAHVGRFGMVFSILIPLLSGALLGWLIGYLKAKHNVNEVLTSIMFNWIIFNLYKYTTSYSPTKEWTTTSGATQVIDSANSLRTENLTAIFGNQSEISWGIFLALFAVIIIWFLLKKTQWGKQVSVTGNNPNAATYAGFNKDKNIITTMTISGALAGLGGAIMYLGSKESLPGIGYDLPGEAFNGIAIALIGFSSPGGMFAASLFMSLLVTSQTFIQVFIPVEIIQLVTGIIIWLVAIVNYFIIYDPIHKISLRLKNRKTEMQKASAIASNNSVNIKTKNLKETENNKIEKTHETKDIGGDR